MSSVLQWVGDHPGPSALEKTGEGFKPHLLDQNRKPVPGILIFIFSDGIFPQ